LKDRASVVIIGGGIIGASVAYHLASEQSITDVVVLDKAKLGTGSTSASLGGFRHQFSNELSIKLTIESVKIIESFQDIFGYDPLVRRDGYVFIASKKDSLEKLEKNADMAKSLGVNVKILSKNELRERFPFYRFEGIEGGSFCQDDGHASTLAVFQGFVSRAKELGVHFVEFAEVQGFITGERSALGVKTNRGPVRADQIVIAAGAYSGAVGKLASAEIPIRPYPRKIFVTERFEDNIPESIPLIVDVDSTLAFGREGKSLIFSDNTHTSSTFEVNSFRSYCLNVSANGVRA
jgi:sarcosine oxidase subunit beta